MFVDTLAAVIKLDRDLDPKLFAAGSVSEDFRTGERFARLYRNPQTDRYEPRVTYLPQTRSLKIEFSVLKMGGEISAVLDRTDVWLRDLFGDLPPFRSWRVSRVDYVADLVAGKLLPSYLAAIDKLRIASWTRVPFKTGVVWKSRSSSGRWIKFYDKGREQKKHSNGVLRFEVSNFRDAVRYMADRWFVCDQTVDDLVKPGRAAFVLCHYWSMLGLGSARFGQHDAELADLRDAFGSRCLAGAAHALNCIRDHGPAAYRDLHLISKSSYYRWLNALREHGFLVQGQRRVLVPLHLSLDCAFDSVLGENLKKVLAGGAGCVKKNSGQNYWPWLARNMGFNSKLPPNQYLLERFYAWAGWSVDSASATMPVGAQRAGIQQSPASSAAGISTLRGFESGDRGAENSDRSGSERPGQRSGVGGAAAGSAGSSL